MSQLPPLPEVFGNYTLRGIEEIAAPPAISLLPSAPGWRCLAVIGILLALVWAWRRLQRWRRNRYRRAALNQLDRLVDRHGSGQALLPALATLLKATALRCRSRTDIASLHGDAWLDWLNRQAPGPVFGDSSRALLAHDLYRAPAELDARAVSTLVNETRQWILLHSEAGHA